MARTLPQSRGVYMFENARREVIYVGKATNLRARVRSYFTQDERKRMGDLRAEVADVRIVPCTTDVEASRDRGAADREARAALQPRRQRAASARVPQADERTASALRRRRRRTDRGDGLHLGPFSSTARARAVASTLSGLFGLRTCTLKLGPHAARAVRALRARLVSRPVHGDRDDDVANHDAAVDELRARPRRRPRRSRRGGWPRSSSASRRWRGSRRRPPTATRSRTSSARSTGRCACARSPTPDGSSSRRRTDRSSSTAAGSPADHRRLGDRPARLPADRGLALAEPRARRAAGRRRVARARRGHPARGGRAPAGLPVAEGRVAGAHRVADVAEVTSTSGRRRSTMTRCNPAVTSA